VRSSSHATTPAPCRTATGSRAATSHGLAADWVHVPTNAPALYVYEQAAAHPDTCRRGLLSPRADAAEDGIVLPHENTIAAARR
jgi:hypothetical protein